jgi:purine nucleosidase
MGGAACAVGNVTPAAEYNIWCDPEATHIVFTSGMNIEMVGWELCRGEANLTEQDIKRCREAINTPLSHFVVDCNIHALKINRDWLGDPGIGLPDPVAMAVAIDPTLATRTSKHYVRVETAGEFTRGMTVVDQLGVAASLDYPVANWRPLVEGKKPNVTVCWELDNKRWKDLLFSLME